MEFRSGSALGDEDTLYARIIEPQSSKPASTPIVLLHPTPLHHGFWLPVGERLIGYRLILPDLRGHGRSPLGTAPSHLHASLEPGSALSADAPVLTIEQLARDAVALLDALKIPQAVFVGCSIGGYTLYELWRTVPERVAGLVFCASKPQADTDAERSKRKDWIAKMEPFRLRGEVSPAPEFVDAMLTALLSQATRRDRPALVGELRSMMEQVRPEAVQAIQRGLGRRPDARSTAQTVKVHTAVIAGEEDTSSTPEDLSALCALLQENGAPSSYHLLTEAGHYAPIEQPTAVAGILNAFLSTLPA